MPIEPTENDCTSLGPPPEPPRGIVATECGDQVCFNTTDFAALLLYLEEIIEWSETTYNNCKPQQKEE